MVKLMQEVAYCVNNEYRRASERHGCYNRSDHEAYAVILEEFEEARDELERVKTILDEFWNLVKADSFDDDKYQKLQALQSAAHYLAAECIQVASTARKAAITIYCRGEIDNHEEGDNVE